MKKLNRKQSKQHKSVSKHSGALAFPFEISEYEETFGNDHIIT